MYRPRSRQRRIDTANQLRFEALEPRVLLTGDGLLGEYFHSIALSQLANARIDAAVNFPIDLLGEGAQGQVTADDNYSIRWTGWVETQQAGAWQFTTHSNDGVRLWVDGTQIIDNWDQHASERDDGNITLAAGWHPIRMEYFQQSGTTDARLLFSGPGQSEVIIPQTRLSSTNPGADVPLANAGLDRVVVLPQGSIVLDGSGTDNGAITSYQWSQISGPNTATLSNATTEDVTASNLIEGTYANYTGDSYLQFSGNSPVNGPPTSPLEYTFKINQSGLYYLHLRAAKDTTHGQPSDQSNDAYVRVEGDYNAGPNAGNSHGDEAPLSLLMCHAVGQATTTKSITPRAPGTRAGLMPCSVMRRSVSSAMTSTLRFGEQCRLARGAR